MDEKYGFNYELKNVNNVLTKEDLNAYFKQLGIHKGMIVYVQTQMEDFAYINGGNQSIIEALQKTLGFEGTLVCSAFSESVVDPVCSGKYAFERDVYNEIRETQPAFNKKRTACEDNEFANQLMRNEGVYRSNHPTHSILAWGKYAKLICDKHPLHFSLGKDSPLDKVSEMNGYILLLGVPYRSCDIFKYAASMCDVGSIKMISSPIENKENKEFITMLEMNFPSNGINEIQQMLEERKIVKETYMGQAYCRFFKAKEASILAQGYYNSFNK